MIRKCTLTCSRLVHSHRQLKLKLRRGLRDAVAARVGPNRHYYLSCSAICTYQDGCLERLGSESSLAARLSSPGPGPVMARNSTSTQHVTDNLSTARSPTLVRDQSYSSSSTRNRKEMSENLADTELGDFLCPISGEIMHDPVRADDGRHYERHFIKKWFRSCKIRRSPISSPWTRAVISEKLIDCPELKQKIANAVHERSLVTGLEGVSCIHDLNAIFKELDVVRELLAETLEGWCPPQLVVIGAESSGKSSLLQRLVMMPILPTAEGVCTRLPIHVRLRFSQQAKAPRLEVYSLSKKQTEEGPLTVSMQSGALDVQEKMTEILQAEHDRSPGVSTDRIIILHVEGPHVPSLDVVDMPGLIATPEHMRLSTRALLERQVKEHGACSMYLAVLPAGARPNTSLAMELVRAEGLEGRTLGVVSRCDELTDKALGNVRRLLADPPDAGLGGARLEPHGWFATMNAPIDEDGESGLARLRRQAAAETAFFRARMPEEVAAGRAGSGALVAGLKGMFRQYALSSWAPETLRRLDEALAAARAEGARLGLPAGTSAI